MPHRFTLGVEEEFQIVDPADLGTEVPRGRVHQPRRHHARGSGQAGTAPVHRRGRARPSAPTPTNWSTRSCGCAAKSPRRPRARGSRSRRPARTRSRTGSTRSSPPASATTRSSKNCRCWRGRCSSSACTSTSGMPDKQTTIAIMNMARYFLPHLLALSCSSPFWMGRNTGLKSFRTSVFRRFPRTGLPEHFESWGEFEDLHPDARRPELHRQRQEDLVGRAAAPAVRHARVPRLRRADAAGRLGGHRVAHPGARLQALQAAQPEPGIPPLPPAAHPGEQVARGPLRHRRQPDRLRQEGRGADAAADARAARRSWTTWWTNWGAGGRCRASSTSCGTARAPTGSCASSKRPGLRRPSWRTSCARRRAEAGARG